MNYRSTIVGQTGPVICRAFAIILLNCSGLPTAHANDFIYQGDAGVCATKPIGGPETNWHLTCHQPTHQLSRGHVAFVYAHIHRVTARHRFRLRLYQDGVFHLTKETDWRYVGFQPELAHSVFLTSFPNLRAGEWRADLFVDTGSGFFLLDQLIFHVLF